MRLTKSACRSTPSPSSALRDSPAAPHFVVHGIRGRGGHDLEACLGPQRCRRGPRVLDSCPRTSGTHAPGRGPCTSPPPSCRTSWRVQWARTQNDAIMPSRTGGASDPTDAGSAIYSTSAPQRLASGPWHPIRRSERTRNWWQCGGEGRGSVLRAKWCAFCARSESFDGFACGRVRLAHPSYDGGA